MPSNNSRSLVIACLCLVLMAATHVNAFAPHPLSSRIQKQQQRAQGTSPFVTTTTTATSSTSTQLQERQWNFNEGQGPFGLKKNAEIWNGRVAQMAFVLVFLQELIQGKGVIDGIKEGDAANIAGLGLFALTTLGLTGFLALKGKYNYVDEELKKMGEK